jgi:hypothetical protein
MKLEIILENQKITLRLLENSKIVDAISWPEDSNLSKKLLLNIEKILKKNRLGKNDLKSVKVINKTEHNITTFRIAKSVADTYNFSLKKV